MIILDILFAICILCLVWLLAMIILAPRGGFPDPDEKITYYHFRVPLVPAHNRNTGGWGWIYIEGELSWDYAPFVRMWKWWQAGFPTRWGK